jgi:hypothetical protein
MVGPGITGTGSESALTLIMPDPTNKPPAITTRIPATRGLSLKKSSDELVFFVKCLVVM